MAFEVFIRPVSGRCSEPGKLRISNVGMARIHAADLKRVGVTTKVVILLDAGTSRIGFRAPREDELDAAAIDLRWNKSKSSGYVGLGGAIRRLGVEDANGLHVIEFRDQDKLFYVSLLTQKKKPR